MSKRPDYVPHPTLIRGGVEVPRCQKTTWRTYRQCEFAALRNGMCGIHLRAAKNRRRRQAEENHA